MRALIYDSMYIFVHRCTLLYSHICCISNWKNLNLLETGAHPIKMAYFDIFSDYIYVIYV